MHPSDLILETVRPIDAHAKLILKWRNDAETLKMSFNSEPKRWDKFREEFLNEYFSDPILPPLFGVYQGKRFGFLRFRIVEHPLSPHQACCEVSINLDPEYRKKGFGTLLLQEMIAWIKERKKIDIYAEILEDNILSRRVFLKAGFKEIGEAKKKVLNREVSIRKYLIVHPSEPLKQRVFIIAEAGSNWKVGTSKQDREMAQRLVEAAAEAEADAIKFQVFKPETVYVPNAGESGYLSQAGISQDISEIFKHLSMPPEMIPFLADLCHKNRIEFMASTFSDFDFDLIDPYVKRHKIASYELNHIHLLRKAAEAKKPLILSTGASTLEEIQWAVKAYQSFGGLDLTLLQCTAQYPAIEESLNLRSIPFMNNYFHLPVGLSDHSMDPLLAPLCAVALGAVIIEKHFTIGRDLSGPDHSFAMIPKELKEMVSSIRRVERMLGFDFKSVQENEIELRNYARRGLQVIRKIKKGEVFKENENFAILRPGKQTLGLHPMFYQEVEGKKAKKDLPVGVGIQLGDWE